VTRPVADVDPPSEFVEAFASLDRARLTRMEEAERSAQLDARQLLRQYVEALWHAVERSGERPEVGEKYHALAVVRALVRSLTTVAFDAVYDGRSPLGPRPAG
jgi:hypothetical protein